MVSDYRIQKWNHIYIVTNHNYTKFSTLFSNSKQGMWINQKRGEIELMSFMSKTIFPFFNKHNIVVRWRNIEKEIDEYYKGLSEVFCYKNSGIGDDTIPIEDISLTICCEEKPRRLIEYLRKKCYQMVTPMSGFYYLSKEGEVDVQIAVIDSTQNVENTRLYFLNHPVRATIPYM